MKAAFPTDMTGEHDQHQGQRYDHDQDRDAQAVEAIKEGDRERYRELIERYERQVYAVAWCRLGDPNLAEEAAQEAFIKGYRHLAFLGQGKKFGAWLMAITRNVAINLGIRHRRELKKRERWALDLDQRGDDMDEAAKGALEQQSPVSQSLRESLAELPGHHRESLALFYLEGKSIAEASELLGVSEGTFKTRLHRARSVLRERLEAQLGESLEQLRPRQTLAPAIIGLMAAERMEIAAATGGMAGFLSKIVLGSAKLLPLQAIMFFIGLVSLIPVLLLMRWVDWLELEAIQDEKKFRTVLRRAQIKSALSCLVAYGWAYWALKQGLLLHQLLGAAALFLLAGLCRQFAVNRSRFIVFQLCALTLFLAWLLVAVFLSEAKNVTLLFGPAIPVLMTVFFRYRPMGRDWNLFWRAAKDLLPDARNASSSPARRFTRVEVTAFTRFLGERFLVRQRRETENGFRLQLPPVLSWMASPLHWPGSGRSELCISYNGQIQALLGEADAKQLRLLSDTRSFAKETIERRVTASVRAAFEAFLRGDAREAEACLNQRSLEDIKPPGISKNARWNTAALVMGALLLIVVGWMLRNPRLTRPDLKPVALSESAVRAALIHKGQVFGSPGSIRQESDLVLCITLPPKHLFTTEAWQKVVGSSFLNLSPDLKPKGTPNDPVSRFMDKRLIQSAFRSGLLNKADLAERGITEESIRAFFQSIGSEKTFALTHPNLEPLSLSDSQHVIAKNAESHPGAPGPIVREEPRTMLSTQSLEDRLQVLRQFGCLDLVDRPSIIEPLRSRQVIPGNTITNGRPIIDQNKWRGLFYYGYYNPLEDTYHALSILSLAGGLDRIDQAACIQGILRFHYGKGFFYSAISANGPLGDSQDTFYAYESLRLLGALGQVKDLASWKFRLSIPSTWLEIEAWLWQERLNRYIEARRKDPSTPAPSLMMDE